MTDENTLLPFERPLLDYAISVIVGRARPGVGDGGVRGGRRAGGVRRGLVAGVGLLLGIVTAAGANADQRLPARLDAGRFVLEITTPEGQVSRWFTDTGGGLFVHAAAVERLGLEVIEVDDGEGGKSRYAALPRSAGAAIPPPREDDGRLFVYTPDPGQSGPFEATYDGMLGQAWHAGRRLVFDYPNATLTELAPTSPLPTAAPSVPLGFKTDDKDVRQLDFPRLTATVAGEPLELLFDTGATVTLTEAALAALGGEASERATSFVVASKFDAWRAAHPEWRVLEEAEAGTGSAMLEVPAVTFAGVTVGPVWFTRRPDTNFHDYMSQWMDTRVDGALGGNAFASLRLTIDYPGARLYVETPDRLTPRDEHE
jgi:hypothetical protein